MPDFSQLGLPLSDIEFLRKKQKTGDLIKLISSEFTGDADQITYTPASGKTFYFLKAKLYPVSNLAIGNVTNNNSTSRRMDVEITNDSTLLDVLTYVEEANVANAAGQSMGQLTNQMESNLFDSLIGNSTKAFKLTSTNNTGTFRVSLLGWIEDS